MGDVGIHRVVTAGKFTLDGQSWDVENNVWLVGDDNEVLVIDAAHDAAPIAAAVGDRRLVGIICTHAHNDHVNAAPDLARATGAPIALHPDDAVLWELSLGDVRPDRSLQDGQLLSVGGVSMTVLHTPGHAPGAVCLYAEDLGVLFSGDTLFAGGPGATGRSFSDFPTIIRSIGERLLSLPPSTVVHTGHGDDTTIGAEAPHIDEWITRGH
jgi:glyoxylase-like metal-dependent hydrolase (beta-lactamase superfamily II)